jgi:hypothetical protein
LTGAKVRLDSNVNNLLHQMIAAMDPVNSWT